MFPGIWRVILLGAALIRAARGDIVGFNGGTLNHNNGAPFISAGGSGLTLTTNDPGEATSWFFDDPQEIGDFSADFTYAAGGDKTADGIAFVVQDDTRGTLALGNSGGDLGLTGISPSGAVALNLFFDPGTSFISSAETSGQRVYQPVAPVSIGSGDPIEVMLAYSPGSLSETLRDVGTGDSFSTQYQIDLAKLLGSSQAYVGFTGGTGFFSSTQRISGFAFTEVTEVPEPGVICLAAAPLAYLAWRRRR